MKYLLTFLSISLISAYSFARDKLGEPITLKNPITIDQAIELNKKNKTKKILISATAARVCQSKGCWMGLESKSGDVRVTFSGYKFFVPFDIVGKKVLVQGSIESKTLSLAETKHFAKDAGKDPEQVTQPKKEYRIVATGVEIL